jgi:hypothetical protein
MNWKRLNDVTRDARPSLRSFGTHSMFWFIEVKGEAIDASVSEREIPACAAFKA